MRYSNAEPQSSNRLHLRMAAAMQARASAGSCRSVLKSTHPATCAPIRSRLARSVVREKPVVCASTVRDEESGAEFQLAQQFWEGETMRCLGAVTRNKKILIVNVQVYSAALYVEADKCAKELGIRARGGFFETDADFCQAILDGAFHKVLAIRLLRDVDGGMFADALNKYLVPRMTLAGELNKLEEFSALFKSKTLTNGTEVLLFSNIVGDLEVLVVPAAEQTYASAKPELRIRSVALCRGMFEIFLGSEPVVAGGIKAWAAGAKNLLDYENVKRSTRKA